MCYWLNQALLCFPCVCVCVSKEQCGSYERPYLPWSQSRIWSRGLCPSHAEHFVINPSVAACAAGSRGGEHQGEAALSFSLSCVKTWGKEWAMCGWACCNMRFDAAFKYVLLASFCPPVVLNSGWNTRTQSGCLIKCEQTLCLSNMVQEVLPGGYISLLAKAHKQVAIVPDRPEVVLDQYLRPSSSSGYCGDKMSEWYVISLH